MLTDDQFKFLNDPLLFGVASEKMRQKTLDKLNLQEDLMWLQIESLQIKRHGDTSWVVEIYFLDGRSVFITSDGEDAKTFDRMLEDIPARLLKMIRLGE